MHFKCETGTCNLIGLQCQTLHGKLCESTKFCYCSIQMRFSWVPGTPQEPRCGFSQRVVSALKSAKEPFESFDILKDEGLRQGLNNMFDWPTFPQLYVNGELLGGCDIITELAASGSLQETIEEMKNRMLTT